MIHGTSIFSVADLNGNNGHLFGKYKIKQQIIDIECIEENTEDGTTYVRVKQTNSYDYIKTSKIFDLHHSCAK